jgi:hypothetical protein
VTVKGPVANISFESVRVTVYTNTKWHRTPRHIVSPARFSNIKLNSKKCGSSSLSGEMG